MTDSEVVVPPFLKKTYEIISTPEFKHICSWGDNNDTIFIKRIDEFAAVVLPKYFKHSNYASFKRQLHKYDFHKTVHDPQHGEFKHPYFVRDQPQLLKLIQRKLYVSKEEQAAAAAALDGAGTLTDGETDVSSERDGTRSKGEDEDEEDDFDFDFDLLEGEGDVELDYEQFDEVEASVERSMIEFDNERISVLEKRQAHLMQDNLLTQHEIRTTLKQNEHLTKAIDVLLHAASSSAQLVGCGETRGVEGLMDDMDDVCELLTTQCQLHAEEGGAEGVIDETLAGIREIICPLKAALENKKRAKTEDS